METLIGVVTHYFNHLCVAVLSLNSELKINDMIHFQGHVTDFNQQVRSMEINHHQVEIGRPGEQVAIKVLTTVHEGDLVYLAPEATPTRFEEIQERLSDSWER